MEVEVSPELCEKLMALGIPLERQDAASLSKLFPKEFKVANFGLSQSDIAEVLIAFVKHGLVNLSALSQVSAARQASGTHVCHFYRDEEEMIKMTATFLEEGLRAGERCLWILPAWLDKNRARLASQSLRQDLAAAEDLGRIFFLTESEVYLNSEKKIRSAQEIINFWIEQEQKARADSFAGIRITGDGTILVSTEQWQSGVDYERLADAAFKGRHVTALCSYSLATVSADRLAEVMCGHTCGLVKRDGKWDELCPGSGVSTAIEFFQAVP